MWWKTFLQRVKQFQHSAQVRLTETILTACECIKKNMFV